MPSDIAAIGSSTAMIRRVILRQIKLERRSDSSKTKGWKVLSESGISDLLEILNGDIGRPERDILQATREGHIARYLTETR
jgi:hypothetical protein